AAAPLRHPLAALRRPRPRRVPPGLRGRRCERTLSGRVRGASGRGLRHDGRGRRPADGAGGASRGRGGPAVLLGARAPADGNLRVRLMSLLVLFRTRLEWCNYTCSYCPWNATVRRVPAEEFREDEARLGRII